MRRKKKKMNQADLAMAWFYLNQTPQGPIGL